MKHLPKLIASIILCEFVGLAGTPFTITAIPTWYATLNKPPFSPPNWVFGPVWTILYFLMGVSFYLIWKQGWKNKQNLLARKYFFIQLTLNFFWSVLFFGLRSPILGLINIVAMWIYIVATIKSFYPISKLASYLLIPYLLWVSFATILNLSIFLLN